MRGEADPNATVTVNENPTFRLGSYYFGSDLFDNSTAGGFANLETYAVLREEKVGGGGDDEDGDDLVSVETNQVYIAQSPETFAYDDDGNQTLITTKTGLWRVTYNGENRPIRWEQIEQSNNPNNRTILQMSYDHMGRRREKNTQHFFYDGYLPKESKSTGVHERFAMSTSLSGAASSRSKNSAFCSTSRLSSPSPCLVDCERHKGQLNSSAYRKAEENPGA